MNTIFKSGIAITSLNSDSQGGGQISFIKSVDAASTPEGVMWADGDHIVTGTLAASSKTFGKFYFVKASSVIRDFYEEYVTLEEDGVYIWERIGQRISIPIEIYYGYLYNGVFYKDEEYTEEIPGEIDRQYTDKATKTPYIWDGESFVSIGGSGTDIPDYSKAINKPSISNHELNGDSSLDDIGIVMASAEEIDALFTNDN